MPGPPPTPTGRRNLRGNPGNRPVNDAEPIPCEGFPDPPDFLDDVAREEWLRVGSDEGARGWISAFDRAAMIIYATAYSAVVRLTKRVEREGRTVKHTNKANKTNRVRNPVEKQLAEATDRLIKICSQMGFTPASRTRVRVTQPPKSNPVDEIAERKRLKAEERRKTANGS